MNFKKALIASTAICAVGAIAATTADAAGKPKLSVSGYIETYFGIADQKGGKGTEGTPTYSAHGATEAGDGFNIRQYGEIRYKVKGKTDSGLKWGVYFEDVQNDAGSDGSKLGSDEVSMSLSGSWGKLEIGGQDGVADKMYAGATKLESIGSGNYSMSMYNQGETLEGRDKTNITDSADATKITYYTPRVNGFQAGYSYAPELSAKGSDANRAEEGEFHEASIAYKGKAAGSKIQVVGNYTRGEVQNGSTKPNTAWRISARLDNGPFSVAAGYVDRGEHDRNKVDLDEKGYDIGVAYKSGRMTVSLVHIATEAKNASINDEYKQTTAEVGYNLGGGLTVAGGISMFDMDADTDAKDNDGTAVLVKIGAKF
jgi:outer membrane protein OmpU